MKKVLILLLCVVLAAVCLVACNKTPTSVSAYKAEGEFTEVHNKLTWEGINAIPQKRKDMTTQEMREMVVQFYLYSKNVVWVAGSDLTYTVNTSLGRNTLKTGTVYGGLPYVSLGSGNVYRMMDYLDEEKGVLDVANAGKVDTLFGNQCSISTFWAWGRAINSAKYCYSYDVVVANDFMRVGPFTYDETWPDFQGGRGTTAILAQNGEALMFESYGQTKLGDGMVHCDQSGHVIMLTGETVVVRDANGKIDPEKSYLVYSDQNTPWKVETNDKGDTFNYTSGMNKQMTFAKAFEKGYIPFTFKEFHGLDPIEDTFVEFTHKGETITREQLFSSKVTANYSFSDTYVEIFDEKGNEVYKLAVRATVPSIYELEYKESGDNVCVWGTWDSVKSGYTVKIYSQLATGERPTLWEGKIA